jgi:hypothetical protein
MLQIKVTHLRSIRTSYNVEVILYQYEYFFYNLQFAPQYQFLLKKKSISFDNEMNGRKGKIPSQEHHFIRFVQKTLKVEGKEVPRRKIK